jgi:hypothetical protein
MALPDKILARKLLKKEKKKLKLLQEKARQEKESTDTPDSAAGLCPPENFTAARFVSRYGYQKHAPGMSNQLVFN